MVEGQKYRVVFMGTSDFAVPSLERLISNGGFDVAAVYTRPDKESGRGLKPAMSPVKKLAQSYGIPVCQPSSLRDSEVAKRLGDLAPDFIIVASYGLILPQNILDMARIAPINVHASLLPKYRGAAPVQRAIMESWQGNGVTGVSIMKMASGLDSGPVYAQLEMPIEGRDSQELLRALAVEGAGLLIDVLRKISSEDMQPLPQDENLATYAPKMEKADGMLDWNLPAAQLDAQIRAVTPWPGARTQFELENRAPVVITLFPGRIGESICSAAPGEIYRDKNVLKIACADKFYLLERLLPEGRKIMSAKDFANGQCKIKSGLCGRATALSRQ